MEFICFSSLALSLASSNLLTLEPPKVLQYEFLQLNYSGGHGEQERWKKGELEQWQMEPVSCFYICSLFPCTAHFPFQLVRFIHEPGFLLDFLLSPSKYELYWILQNFLAVYGIFPFLQQFTAISVWTYYLQVIQLRLQFSAQPCKCSVAHSNKG